MSKGKLIKLPNRQPRGHPDNITRVTLLATSSKAKLIDRQWYVYLKNPPHDNPPRKKRREYEREREGEGGNKHLKLQQLP